MLGFQSVGPVEEHYASISGKRLRTRGRFALAMGWHFRTEKDLVYGAFIILLDLLNRILLNDIFMGDNYGLCTYCAA